MTLARICRACGTTYSPGKHPEICRICADDRRFIPAGGQVWTDRNALLARHQVTWVQTGADHFSLQLKPEFALSQRAFLICRPGGNILWDCIPLLDQDTIDRIGQLGGLRAIAISHPHHYSNMKEWAEAFNCPVLVHGDDAHWVPEPGGTIAHWGGDMIYLWDDLSLVRLGGHFPGSSVLLAPQSSAGGSLFCGDSLLPAPSGEHIAVQYSYCNHIPLAPGVLNRVFRRLSMLNFDTLHSSAAGRSIAGNARQVLSASKARYGC